MQANWRDSMPTDEKWDPNQVELDLVEASELDDLLDEFYQDDIQEAAPPCTDTAGNADVLASESFDLGSDLLTEEPKLVAEGATAQQPDMGAYQGADFSTEDLVNDILASGM